MGGYGSTRWGGYWPKDTVEGSIGIRMADLQKYAPIGWHSVTPRGSFTWQPSGASVGYTLAGQSLSLSYRMRGGNGDAWQEKRDTITLEYTTPHYGGRRWWFTCPLCHRRAGAVYLDTRRGRFVCRVCAGLAYRSQQTHDKRLDTYARNTDAALAALAALDTVGPGQATTAQVLAAMKALEMQTRLGIRDARKHRRR